MSARWHRNGTAWHCFEGRSAGGDDALYQELGHDYLDKLQPHRVTRYLVKRLESLGHEVTLEPVDRAA